MILSYHCHTYYAKIYYLCIIAKWWGLPTGVWNSTINISIDFYGVFLCLFGIIGVFISKKIIEHRYKMLRTEG